MAKQIFLPFVFVMVVLTSCKDDPITLIEAPVSYEFTRSGVSSVSFSGQTIRIDMATELINAMNDFSQTEDLLIEMYANKTIAGGDADPFANPALNQSTKSVQSKIAASTDLFSSNTVESAAIKANIESWIRNQVLEVFPNQNELAAPGIAGQVADGSSVRYVNAKGLEYNQAVSKALIGALMVDQISNHYLSPTILDAGNNRTDNEMGVTEDDQSYTNMEHKWDEAYGYLFGKSADQTNPLATLGDDSFLNKYLSKVNDDADFEGIASDIYEAFKLGRAAIVVGDYQIRDEQAEIIKAKLAQVVAIRAVYYLQQGKKAIQSTDFGGAFHYLSEGFGFIYSLRFTRKPNSTASYFTSNEVNDFIDQLTTGNGFWEVSGSTLDQISNAIAAKFNFTVAQAAE